MEDNIMVSQEEKDYDKFRKIEGNKRPTKGMAT